MFVEVGWCVHDGFIIEQMLYHVKWFWYEFSNIGEKRFNAKVRRRKERKGKGSRTARFADAVPTA